MEEIELPKTEELEELKARKFTKRVALITAVYAVMLAITGLGGGKCMKEMLLGQQEASNQWAFYQAKAMRENLYKIQKMNMEANLLERNDSIKPEARSRFVATIEKMAAEEKRYATEKTEIEHEARKAEHERDVNKKRDPYFEFAEGLLQISIVMASIAILSSFSPVFYFSLVLAALGAFFSFNGFTLLFHLPFF
jgi:hypothetical protein